MSRLSGVARPRGLAGEVALERWPLTRHQLASLATGAGLILILLLLSGAVPLPSLVDRWWQAIVPGSASPSKRPSLPAYPGPFLDGVGQSRADAGLQRLASPGGATSAGSSIARAKPALG